MMRLAPREVVELADRCFAAAGFAEGPARANAEAVWWTELYRDSGLRTLHGLLSELPEWNRDDLTLDDRSGSASLIDAGGQPGLVSGSAAADLASAAAGRHGVGIARATAVRNDATLPMLGHAASTAAERGFLSVVLATDGAERHRTLVAGPDGPYPIIAERELDAPSAGHTALSTALETGMRPRRDDPLTQAFFTRGSEVEYRTAGERLLNRLLHRSVEPDPSGTVDPEFLLVCLDPDHPRHPDALARVVEQFVETARLTRRFDPAEIHDRAETLLREGVAVEEAVWRDVFDRSSEVLAPEFEGSYRGAGFDINE